jgi:hypothetical protein
MAGSCCRHAASALALLLLVHVTHAASGGGAPFRLARAFSSSMVLQAEYPSVSGWAPRGAAVTVTTSDSPGDPIHTTADSKSGAWTADLPARSASPPLDSAAVTLTASSPGQPDITLTDVLFGDVWVCSGQSNMEFAVAEVSGERYRCGCCLHSTLSVYVRPYVAAVGRSDQPPQPLPL